LLATNTDRGRAPLGSDSVPAFVGLIGSRSKRICLFGRLIGAGISEDVVKRVQCPIGVGDTGKEPRMVAISMAAGVLLEAKRMEGGGAIPSRALRKGSAAQASQTRAENPTPLAELA
jgi:xanthine/CO dehydrogenase XdhC/CoxF family maturation factor